MLVNCHSPLERMVADLSPNSHHSVLEHSLAIDFLLLSQPNDHLLLFIQVIELILLIPFFVLLQWSTFKNFSSPLKHLLVDSLLLLLNLVVLRSLNVKLGCALPAIDRVEFLQEESDESVHVLVVLDHQVDSSRGELEGQALP